MRNLSECVPSWMTSCAKVLYGLAIVLLIAVGGASAGVLYMVDHQEDIVLDYQQRLRNLAAANADLRRLLREELPPMRDQRSDLTGRMDDVTTRLDGIAGKTQETAEKATTVVDRADTAVRQSSAAARAAGTAVAAARQMTAAERAALNRALERANEGLQ